MIPSRNLMFGSDWTAETRALVAAMAVPPGGARMAQIDALIKALKFADVWRLLDVLYVLAAHDSQAARLNWKSPEAFALSPSNAPVFTADRGYTGDGATSGLTGGPNLATFGGLFSLNDAHIGVWCGTDATENVGDAGVSSSAIRSHAGSSLARTLLNDGTATNSTLASNTAVGHSVMSRSNSANYAVYKDGIGINTIAVTSTAITNANMSVCFVGSGFSTKRIAAAHVGASLTASQVAALYEALSHYMTKLGA